MTRHGLGGRDIQLVCCVTKDLLDSLCLRDITDMGGSAMNIDVVNILRLQSSVLQGVLHHELGTQTLRVRSGDVMGIGTHTSTYHLTIDLRTTSFGMLQLLENQAAGTLTHDETVTAGTERTTCLLGLVITG